MSPNPDKHPMHNPKTVAKKVATFKKNFSPATRKRFSDAAKKKWKDSEFRAKRKKAWDAAMKGKKDKWDDGRKLGNPASLSKESQRKKSKTKEHSANNKNILYRKNGKEKVTKVNNRGTEKRINDYSGVITKEELAQL